MNVAGISNDGAVTWRFPARSCIVSLATFPLRQLEVAGPQASSASQLRPSRPGTNKSEVSNMVDEDHLYEEARDIRREREQPALRAAIEEHQY
jgi:hypothetical protein